jgi:methylenetetrahydrofolate reductase (NADPH)
MDNKMKISTIFENKKKLNKPVLSFEIFPPKKEEELKNIDATLELLCALNPDFISVTFGAGGSSVNNKTLEIAKKIKDDYGIEPLVHITCLHYDRGEITQLLDAMEAADIENVLALRGDVNPNMEIKHDFKYANELVEFIKSRNRFCISAACYPETHIEAEDSASDLMNLRRKVGAGVDHLVSQLFFDNEAFFSFCSRARAEGIEVPIDAGVMPVTNKAQIERMVNMCGATLPPKFRKMLDKYADNREALFEAGMAYTINQIVDLISNDVEGVHIYTMNNPHVAKRICDGIKKLI